MHLSLGLWMLLYHFASFEQKHEPTTATPGIGIIRDISKRQSLEAWKEDEQSETTQIAETTQMFERQTCLYRSQESFDGQHPKG